MRGSIVTNTLKSGGKSYSAVYRIPTGRQVWKTFPKRKLAERHLATTVKKIHEGDYTPITAIPVSELFERFERALDVRVKQGDLKDSTRRMYQSILRTIRPAFADYRTDRWPARSVTEWAAAMADRIAEGDIAAGHYNNCLSLLRACVKWDRAPAQGYLAHDPLIGQKSLRLTRKEPMYLQRPQITALLAAAEPPDDTVFKVLLYSGVRRGECFALQWGDVDWGTGQDGGRLHVRRGYYRGRTTSPKTKSSVRVIDVPQPVLDDLNVYRAMYPPLGGDLIFRTASGTPLCPDNWTDRCFLPTLKRAGLPHMGLHALRHTYASLLIAQGESPKYVAKQLGHASIGITMDLYVHLFPETSVAAMRRLGAGIKPNGDLTKGAVASENTVDNDGVKVPRNA